MRAPVLSVRASGLTPIAFAALLAGASCARKPGGDDSAHPPAKTAVADATSTGAAPGTAGGRERAPQDAAAVVFSPTGHPAARVAVEVARTSRQIQLGLMYRTSLPPDAGMLFLFRTPKVQTFWMKNTLIPLDMIFVGADMKVVGVVERAEPKTLTSRQVDGPSQYVVEVNGGWARTHGVGPGTQVSFAHVAPLGPGEGMD